jgi:hypothetical protein
MQHPAPFHIRRPLFDPLSFDIRLDTHNTLDLLHCFVTESSRTSSASFSRKKKISQAKSVHFGSPSERIRTSCFLLLLLLCVDCHTFDSVECRVAGWPEIRHRRRHPTMNDGDKCNFSPLLSTLQRSHNIWHNEALVDAFRAASLSTAATHQPPTAQHFLLVCCFLSF